jgi:uncharacterized protein YndB with AHSA1/START domain
MSSHKNVAQQEGYVAHGNFTIERHYPVAAERVFAAFSDSKTKARWFSGDDSFKMLQFDVDCRTDGRDVYRFTVNNGPEIRNDTQYHEVQPNRRLVFSYKMGIGGALLSASLVTLTLTPDAKGTLMTYTEQGAYFDNSDWISGREHGTRWVLEKLATVLAQH